MGLRVRDLDAAVEFQADGARPGRDRAARPGRLPDLQRAPPRADPDRVRASAATTTSGSRSRTPTALERARRGVAAAGGEPIGDVYDGEPGIDRAAAGARPGRPRLQALLRDGDVVAPPPPGDRPSSSSSTPRSRPAGLGPTERFLATASASPSRDRMGRTASWWHCDADHHGMALIFGAPPRALPLRLVGARPQRDGADRRPPRRRAGSKLHLGPEPPRSRQQPVRLLPRPGRGDGRVLRRAGGDAAARRLRGADAGPAASARSTSGAARRRRASSSPASRSPTPIAGVAAMKLRRTAEGLIAERRRTARWSRAAGRRSPTWSTFLARRRGGARRRRGRRSTRAAADPAAAAVDPGAAILPFQPRTMRAFIALGVALRSPPRGCWSSASSRRRWRGSSPATSGVTGRTFPKLKPNKRFYETPVLLRRQPRGGARRRRGDVVAEPHRLPRLRAGAGLRARQAARRRHARGGRGRGRRLVRPQRLERPRRAGRGRPPQRLRPGGEVEDLRQLDRRRRHHRRRAARLAGGDGAGSASTASSGARARRPAPRTTSARCWPTPRRASGSSPAT